MRLLPSAPPRASVQQRRAYAVTSASSSSISSALSFSSTSDGSSSSADDLSDDWASDSQQQHALDDDPEVPRERPRRRGLVASRSSSASSYTTTRRAITMQAIRNAETLGFVALLIPLTGILTMVVTETLACMYHFDCARNYPTLSYAATFSPEGRAFTIGMCLTALFILVSSALFYWFLRLRLALGSTSASGDTQAQYTSLMCLIAGVATAVTLSGLAIFDMRSYHDAHIVFTVTFFIASWVLIVFCHLARRVVLLRGTAAKDGRIVIVTTITSEPSTWAALQRWRRLSIPMAFALGRFFILAGITSTALFGLLFMCVNGSWPNPLGFTAVQEAFFEAFAIVCQLLFMGTLSCELALLSREVEARDYMELERRE